jgi:hypothetical protein
VGEPEVALRRRLGETRLDAVRLLGQRRDGDTREVSFRVGGVDWLVSVRTTPGADRHLLTCRALRDNPVPEHDVLAVSRAPATP